MYLLFILVILFLCFCKTEGYLSNNGFLGYMKNKSTSEYPDDTVFYSCNEKVKLEECDNLSEINCENKQNCIYNEGLCKPKRFPNNHYKIDTNAIKEPLEGTFSAFLDVNKIRTYDHFYHSPICEDTYEFISDTKNQNRPIIQEEDEISGLLEREKKMDEESMKDPLFTYESSDYEGNRILHDSNLQTLFLEVKDGMRRQDDFSHLEGYNTAYDVNSIHD